MTSEAQKKLLERLGYHFKDEDLLTQALTHSSILGAEQNNERLEFLGDKVIGLIIADQLYKICKGDEGELTLRYHHCVSNETLTQIAREIKIADALHAEAAHNDKVLADALEALIGAVWCDGGFEAVQPIIVKVWKKYLENSVVSKDSKTLLQEYALAHKLELPSYDFVKQEGDEHAPTFTMTVNVGEASAEGEGTSKQKAEQAAAAAMLEILQ